MIPPSPLHLTLWASALYIELATGLWRALAAPWLQPGWPASTCVADRQRVRSQWPAARPPDPRPRAVDRPWAEPAEGRVIEVPPGRWQRPRSHGRTFGNDG